MFKLAEMKEMMVNLNETDNKQFDYLRYYDNLTGIYNRLYFHNKLQSLDSKERLPLSIIVGDINGLKLINERFGYQMGDQFLQNISGLLQEVCHKDSILARIGGDEFAFLLPKVDTNGANKFQEEIKIKLAQYEFASITPSIALGAATKSKVAENINQKLSLAEERMYKHKLIESNSFRNCIISPLEKSLLEKSNETEKHNSRLKELVLQIGKELNLTNAQLDELEILARLHDIGKIAIPDSILKKPGSLTEEEWAKMKEHPEIGYRIAAASKELSAIADKILAHHERWDGDGYPNGLEKEEIPLLSRIASVVDAYDAMTNDRVYRAALTPQEAKEELISCAGTQFDPRIVDVFTKYILTEEGRGD